MGIGRLLSKDGRKQRQLEKNTAKAGNNKLKLDDRYPALQSLIADGSPDAIAGVLKRFTFTYTTNVVNDEEEKSYVYEELLLRGAKTVLPQLDQHLATSPSCSWGLRLLGELGDENEIWASLDQLLPKHQPGYTRDPSRKMQLINFLSSRTQDARTVETLIPYLEDHDEAIRVKVVEALVTIGHEAAREPLLAILVDEEDDSLRTKNRIAEGFADLGWTVKGQRGTVERLLADSFSVDGKGRLKAKKSR